MAKYTENGRLSLLLCRTPWGEYYRWIFATEQGRNKAICALWKLLDRKINGMDGLRPEYGYDEGNPYPAFEKKLKELETEIRGEYLPHIVPAKLKSARNILETRYRSVFASWDRYCKAKAAYEEAKSGKSADLKWEYIRNFLLPGGVFSNLRPGVARTWDIDILTIEIIKSEIKEWLEK